MSTTSGSIVRATAELWRLPLKQAIGGSGITVIDVVVVDLEDGAGNSGTGFTYVLGGGGATVRLAAEELLLRFVAGRAVIPPPALWRTLAGSLGRTGRGTGYVAIAAIDVAAWDLWAGRRGETLATALGGVARAMPVYGSGHFTVAQPVEESVEHARAYAAMGCGAVKLRVAGQPADIARLRAVRAALPATVHMMADANERCDLVQALWFARAAADLNLLWLEEPLPAYDVEGHIRLAAASPVPIATGEHLQGTAELAPFLEHRVCAVVQPDLAKMGGLTECLRVATIAAHFGVAVAPHFLPWLFVHMAAAAPAVTWLEDFPTIEPLFAGLPAIGPDGTMRPADAPGHGLRWADGARTAFRVTA